jgi:LPXTG-motif cell wall-anchored protein
VAEFIEDLSLVVVAVGRLPTPRWAEFDRATRSQRVTVGPTEVMGGDDGRFFRVSRRCWVILRPRRTVLQTTGEFIVKHTHRTRTGPDSSRFGGRAIGALLIAFALVLLGPSMVGAQDGDIVTPPDVEDGEPVEEVEDTTTTTTETTETTETTVTVPPVEAPPEEPTTTLPPAPTAKNITVEQTPDPEQGPCVVRNPPLVDPLSNFVRSTPEEFRLRIIVSEPLCEPIEATAVIYAMPGNGESWPQRFVEKLDFTLQEAGETVVTFTKTCDPVQFDVITGATPEVIDPLGEWHGPLLFGLDTSTSFQHWGCPVQVLESTTVPAVAPAQLALTGNTSTNAATAGGALLLAGAVLFMASRRRTA